MVHQQNQYAPVTQPAYRALDIRHIQEPAHNGTLQHVWPDVRLVTSCGVAARCHIQALLLRC